MNQLWSNLARSFQGGKLHFFFPSGEAVATWVLCAGVVLSWWSLRTSKKDRKHDEQFRNFRMMRDKFNGRDMLFARAKTAEDMLAQDKLSIMLGHPPAHCRKILAFFMQIQQMLKRKELDFEDVALEYGDYIMMIGSKFKSHLEASEVEPKYHDLLELYRGTTSSKRYRQFQDELATYFDKEFWECESSLLKVGKRNANASFSKII
jgi:hypothetical protein